LPWPGCINRWVGTVKRPLFFAKVGSPSTLRRLRITPVQVSKRLSVMNKNVNGKAKRLSRVA